MPKSDNRSLFCGTRQGTIHSSTDIRKWKLLYQLPIRAIFRRVSQGLGGLLSPYLAIHFSFIISNPYHIHIWGIYLQLVWFHISGNTLVYRSFISSFIATQPSRRDTDWQNHTALPSQSMGDQRRYCLNLSSFFNSFSHITRQLYPYFLK